MAAEPNESAVCPTLIGRDAHVQALRQLSARVAAGSGHAVVVAGEAGIGKSRLIREFADEMNGHGWLVQQANCFERDRVLPYAPFVDLLHGLLASLPAAEIERCLGPARVDLARLLPDLAPHQTTPALDAEQEKRRIFSALGGVLSRLSATHPLLLVFEDVHWADDESLELLGALARRAAGEPLLLVGTFRDDEVSDRLADWLDELHRRRLAIELRLRRLDRDEVSAMLRAMSGPDRTVRHDVRQAIYSLTEGNPFFVEELVRSLSTSGSLPAGARSWDRTPVHELRLPRSVHDAVRRRTDRLSPAARQVLALAAVAGRRFDFELLRALTGHSEAELVALMKELITAQLVIEVDKRIDQFAFRHALTRQAVYEQLLGRERRSLHRRIAQTIEHRPPNSLELLMEDLAYHYSEAGDWPKALEYAQRAGERADALCASASAVEHYTRAIEAARLQAIPVAPRLHRALGLALERLGNFEGARAEHEAALTAARAAGDRRAEWEGRLDLGFLWAGRDYDQTRIYFAEALDLARTFDDPVALARSLNRVGNWHLNVEQAADAGRYHLEALAIFERLGDRRGIAESLDLLGLVEYMQGNLRDAVGHNERSIALFRELDDRAALASVLAHPAAGMPTYHSATAPVLPEYTRPALRKFEEAIQLADELDLRASAAFGRAVLAMALGPRGEYARALTEVATALQIAEDIDHRQWACAARYTLGELHRDLLALDEARRYFELALDLARELGSGNWSAIVTGSLASTLVACGQSAPAAAALEAHGMDIEPPSTMGRRHIRLAMAELALCRRQAALALRLLKPLLADSATAPAVTLVRARALRALGRLDEAEAVLHEANRLANSCTLASLSWRLQAELAAVLDAQRRRPEAEVRRTEALAIVQRLAQQLTDPELMAGFLTAARQAIGIEPPGARTVQPDAGRLTPRELEVAMLVAAGLTNRQIAERLVIAPRTADNHLQHIFDKLGVSSRAQVAAWATLHGSSG